MGRRRTTACLSKRFSLTPGQASDLSQAEPLLDQVDPQALLADKAYDADALIQNLEDRRITPRHPTQGQPRSMSSNRSIGMSRQHVFGRCQLRCISMFGQPSMSVPLAWPRNA